MAVTREDIETYKTLMRSGQLRQALDHLKALLNAHAPDKGLLATAAPLAVRLGDHETAVSVYESLLGFDDVKAADLFNIGYALKKLGQFKPALSAYQRAIGAGVSRPEEAYQNIGVIYADELHNIAAAETAFLKSISLNPAMLGPYINLGNLYEETGKFEKAAKIYREAVSNVDNAFEAIARLSNAHEFERLDDPLFETLKSALKSPQASDFDKECLHFAMGTALDKLGDHENAWSHFAKANAHGERYGAAYDAARMEDRVDDIIASYHPRLFSSDASRENNLPAPIFICGMFRSGSTLTEQILSAHPDFTPLGECGFIPVAANAAPDFYPKSSAKLSPEQCRTLRDDYYRQAAVQAVTTPYFTDKRPDNLLYVGLIKQIFPDAKIIFTERQALDIYLSIFFTQFGDGQAYARKFEAIVHYHEQQNKLMAHWQSLFGSDVYYVNYDALIARPKPQISALLSSLSVSWNDTCLNFHTQSNRVKTASYKQVRRPFYKTSSGRAKNYEKWIPSVDL